MTLRPYCIVRPYHLLMAVRWLKTLKRRLKRLSFSWESQRPKGRTFVWIEVRKYSSEDWGFNGEGAFRGKIRTREPKMVLYPRPCFFYQISQSGVIAQQANGHPRALFWGGVSVSLPSPCTPECRENTTLAPGVVCGGRWSLESLEFSFAANDVLSK